MLSVHTIIRTRRASFFGYTMRRVEYENIVATGNISSRRGRSRPRKTILDGSRRWHRGIASTENRRPRSVESHGILRYVYNYLITDLIFVKKKNKTPICFPYLCSGHMLLLYSYVFFSFWATDVTLQFQLCTNQGFLSSVTQSPHKWFCKPDHGKCSHTTGAIFFSLSAPLHSSCELNPHCTGSSNQPNMFNIW